MQEDTTPQLRVQVLQIYNILRICSKLSLCAGFFAASEAPTEAALANALNRARIHRRDAMGLILLLVVLVLLFGGGGFYMGPPYHYYGGGLGTILVIVIVVLLLRG
jgi:hypothetical protein